MNKKKEGWVTTRKERVAYALYFIGQLLCYTIVSSFTLSYLLNEGLSEVLVGSILVIPKIWDAVNDTLLGFIIDKFKFKKGRFLPWVKLSSIVLPLTTILFFAIPSGLPINGKAIWVIVAYVLWDGAYTLADAPVYALCTSMSRNGDERNSILSATRITGGLGGIICSILVPVLYGKNGANLGWTLTAVIVAVVSLLTFLPICIFGKERYNTEREKEPSFKDMFKALVSNKQLLAFQAAKFICFLTMTMDVLNPVFAQYVLENETMASLLSMAVGMPIMILAIFIPTIVRKWDKANVFVFFMAFFVGISVIQYFAGYHNSALMFGLVALKGMFYGGFNTLAYFFIPDCIEYSEYKTGERNEGISFGVQSFITKLDTALVSTLAAYVIYLLGFNANNVTPQGKNAVWMTLTIFSAIGPLIAIFIFKKFYHLKRENVALITAFNNKEISREECEKQLSGLK